MDLDLFVELVFKLTRSEVDVEVINLEAVRGDEGSIRSVIEKCGASVGRINYERDLECSVSTYSITVSFRDESSPKKILDGVSALPLVKKVVITS